jgi:hypothetical protein
MASHRQLPRDPGLELARLDELIGELDERIDTPQGLMREHLQEARSCLLASMPGEYQMTLELAREVLPLVDEPVVHAQIEEFLERQMTA